MKVYTTFIQVLSASITRGVTYAKLTHTVAEGRYTTAPYLFSATGAWAAPGHMTWYLPWRTCTYPKAQRAACAHPLVLRGLSLISLNGFSRKPVGLLTAGY
jgi:hypothetical protein